MSLGAANPGVAGPYSGDAYIHSHYGADLYLGVSSSTGDIIFSTNNYTERMRITADGNVGIGTATPTTRLHVAASSDPLRLEGLQSTSAATSVLTVDGNGIVYTTSASSLGGGNAWLLTGNSGTNPASHFLGTTDNQPLVIRTNNAEVMRVTATGNVGIGTPSPQDLLHVHKAAVSGVAETIARFSISDASGYLQIANNVAANNTFMPRLYAYTIGYNGPALTIAARTNNDGVGQTEPLIAVDAYGPSASLSIRPLFQVRNSGSPQVTVTATGDIGIGTVTPDRDITLSRSGSAYFNIKDGSREILLGTDPNGGILSVMSNHDLIFRTGNNVEKMRITASGNVGIGISNPPYKLYVRASHSANVDYIGGMFEIEQTAPSGFTLYGHRTIARATHTTGLLHGLQAISAIGEFQGSGGTTNYGDVLTAGAVITGGATVNNLRMMTIYAPNNSGTIQNLTGILIEDMTAGSSSNYSIYSLGGTMYHAGDIGIGTSFPQSALEIYRSGGSSYPTLRLSDGDVLLPVFTSNSLGEVSGSHAIGLLKSSKGAINNLTKGGLALYGFTDNGVNDWYPLSLVGTHGGSSPTEAAVLIAGQKIAGGARARLTGSEVIMDVATAYDPHVPLGGQNPQVVFRIRADGHVGIGTLTPATKLVVWGPHTGAGAGNGSSSNAPSQAIIPAGSDGTTYLNDWPNGWGGGLATWDICGAGILMSGYWLRSDRQYKTHIVPLVQDQTDLVRKFLQLEPVAYFPNPETMPVNDPDRKRFGFVANDVEKLFPNLVLNAGAPPEIARGLEYDGFIPILVAVVQQQQHVLEQQQQRIEQLLEENQRIREENAQLKAQIAEIQALKSRLARIEALLGSKGAK